MALGMFYAVVQQRQELKDMWMMVQKAVYMKVFHERIYFADGPSSRWFNQLGDYLECCDIHLALTQWSPYDFWSCHFEVYIIGDFLYGGAPHFWDYFWNSCLHIEFWAPEYCQNTGVQLARTSKFVLRSLHGNVMNRFRTTVEAHGSGARPGSHRAVQTSGDHADLLLHYDEQNLHMRGTNLREALTFSLDSYDPATLGSSQDQHLYTTEATTTVGTDATTAANTEATTLGSLDSRDTEPIMVLACSFCGMVDRREGEVECTYCGRTLQRSLLAAFGAEELPWHTENNNLAVTD